MFAWKTQVKCWCGDGPWRVAAQSWAAAPATLTDMSGHWKKKTNAAFTLNGFDNQERNLSFVKTDFHVLKLKFYTCKFKKDFYPLQVKFNCNIFFNLFDSTPLYVPPEDFRTPEYWKSLYLKKYTW